MLFKKIEGTHWSAILVTTIFAIMPLIYSESLVDPNLLPRIGVLAIFCFVSAVLIGFRASQIQLNTFKHPLIILVLVWCISYWVSLVFALNKTEGVFVTLKISLYSSFFILVYLMLQLKIIEFIHIAKGVCIGVIFSILLVVKDLSGLNRLQISVFESDNIYKVNATFGHKNLLASYLILALPFLLILIRKSNRWGKIFLISIISIVLGILVLLQTRAALLALLISAIVYVFQLFLNSLERKSKLNWIIPVLGLCIVLGFFGSIYVFRDKFSVITRTESFLERAALWQNTFDMIKEFPLGVGAGNWQIFLPKYGVQKFYEFNYRVTEGLTTFQRPHNDFLWVWSEVGPIGGLAFLGLFILAIITVLRNKEFRFKKEVLSAVVAFGVISLFDFPLERIEHSMMLMTILAFVVPTGQIRREFKSSFRFSILSVLIVLVSSCVIWWSYQRSQSELSLKKMYKAHLQKNWLNLTQSAQKANSQYMNMDYFSIPILWYAGVANFGQGDLQNAKCNFADAYQINPYQIHVLNNLGVCLEKEKNYREALPLLEQAISISPTFSDGISTLAGAYYNCKRYQDAWRIISTFKYDESNKQYLFFATAIVKANLNQWLSLEKNTLIKKKIISVLSNNRIIEEKLKTSKNKNISYFVE